MQEHRAGGATDISPVLNSTQKITAHLDRKSGNIARLYIINESTCRNMAVFLIRTVDFTVEVEVGSAAGLVSVTYEIWGASSAVGTIQTPAAAPATTRLQDQRRSYYTPSDQISSAGNSMTMSSTFVLGPQQQVELISHGAVQLQEQQGVNANLYLTDAQTTFSYFAVTL